MFSFFNKKPKCERLNDKVFVKREEADDAMVTAVKNFRSEGKNSFILYFFEDTMKRIQTINTGSDLHFFAADKLLRDLSVRSSLKARSNLVLLFAEHHPSAVKENAILSEIENIFEDVKPEIGFYVALEEPMMKRFGADKIIALMKQLGMKEGEAIAHSLVTKSIANMQEKIAKKSTADLVAHSQEEWMKLNYDKN